MLESFKGVNSFHFREYLQIIFFHRTQSACKFLNLKRKKTMEVPKTKIKKGETI
jgi:hypothetical protein